MSQIHLESYTMLETENLNSKFQPIQMKELSVIAIYRGQWGKADYLRNSMQYLFTECLY